MPLFNLKNAKKKLSSSSLSLRKTQSTGDIEEENVFTNDIKSSKSSPTTTTTTTTVKKPTHISSMTTKRPTTGILLNSSSSTTTTTVPSSLLLTPVVEQPNESVSSTTTTTNDLLTAKLKDITACDMDLLLALETQARMDIQEEKQLLLQRRPTRLTFDIPPTPSITTTTTRIDDQGEKKNRSDSQSSSLPTITSSGKEFNLSHTFFSKTKLSRWSRALHKEEGHTTTVLEDYADPVPVIQQSILIGSKVKLIKRPLPIIGTVKYIGKVHFDSSQEDWLGIELDTRVGNTDGKVGDTRYFQTKSNCGIFVRKQDTIKV
ncbi:uncharacterized protein BX663DRAFT_549868 [Cokeromyces recurvatus]|uniref:uncharacterized protein n=1 Tax=Cokeromyces recurvatus TaxID=90255 RepID=UPI00221FF19B|nr:uncharacterized protein BX663DRAFT_549868 [Cokeromyces recurvatus]KAI7905008.1 hypothetical protein BX663DRAFT_549868 [Cokeromyces recurvatus]